MELGEVRKEINVLDDSMKQLFDNRMLLSNKVAEVKLLSGDEVYKPLREKEICDRYSSQGDGEYAVFIKKVMQLSRKRQYGRFFDAKQGDDAFISFLGCSEADALTNGGTIGLKLEADSEGISGLSVSDIISVIADYNVTIKKLSVDLDTVFVSFKIGEDKASIRDARLLVYLLFKEAKSISLAECSLSD